VIESLSKVRRFGSNVIAILTLLQLE